VKPDGKTLIDRLHVMVEEGINTFDPVRFSYIESLARRAAPMPEAVRVQLEERAVAALADYESCFKRAQKEAEKLIEHMASTCPEAAGPLQRLYSAKDFKGVQRMIRKRQRTTARSPLGVLLEQISGENRLASQEADSFETLLHRREDEMPDETGRPPGRKSDAPPGSEVSDLKSYQLFRETWARHYSDKLVSDAVRKLPKNPGPLNSELLITRSLTIMRNLSPNYLKRFVSYVDTLLWLEDAAK
jgi:hypothetical protein